MFDPSKYQTVDINGHKIAYQRSGSGQAVLMVHGITTYSFIWRKLIAHLEDDYDLIRVDLLGCGHSEMVLSNYLCLKNQASILIQLISELGLEKVHLVGHDLGGGIAQIMAVNSADKLISVSLLNPVGYDYWPVKPISSMRTPIFRLLAMAAFDRGYYRSIVKKGLFKPESMTEEFMSLFWSNFETSLAKKSFMRFAKCLNVNDLLEIEEQIKAIKLPVLILHAEKDVYLSSEITKRLHEDISDSQYIEIPEAGHYMQEDSPLEIANALKLFWA